MPSDPVSPEQVTTPAAVEGRMRWRCRRGMKELELLLEGFLERGYARLDQAGRAAFERLLEMPDPVLAGWLIGDARPMDGEMARVVAAIRAGAAP